MSVDGKEVGSGAVSASHADGGSQDFTFSGDFGSGQHDIAVTYNNDAYGGTAATDRNLYVNSIDYNGQHFGSATAAMHSDGTVDFMVGTGS